MDLLRGFYIFISFLFVISYSVVLKMRKVWSFLRPTTISIKAGLIITLPPCGAGKKAVYVNMVPLANCRDSRKALQVENCALTKFPVFLKFN